MVYIRVETEIRPTEDESKVVKAIKNVFMVKHVKIVDVGRGYKLAIAESNDISTLLRLYELLRVQRILDTARNYLMKGLRDNCITFKLNKQAAYSGVVSFVDDDSESQLGAIHVTIVSDKIDEIIDWLTPRTSRGRPLWERDVPEGV